MQLALTLTLCVLACLVLSQGMFVPPDPKMPLYRYRPIPVEQPKDSLFPLLGMLFLVPFLLFRQTGTSTTGTNGSPGTPGSNGIVIIIEPGCAPNCR